MIESVHYNNECSFTTRVPDLLKCWFIMNLTTDCLSTGSPPVLSTAEAVGIVTAEVLITAIPDQQTVCNMKTFSNFLIVMSWICIEL